MEERSKETRKSVGVVQLRDFIEAFSEKDGETPSHTTTVTILELAQKIIDEQAVEIQHLKKQLFGRRSEKISKAQLSLFARMLEAITDNEEEEPKQASDADESKKSKKKRKKRKPLEVTRTEVISVPDEERPCPECEAMRCTLGHVKSIVVEYTPAKLEVIEYLREKVVCRPCEGEIIIAPPPKERVIDRALPGPNMLSALVVNKTVDGLPLHRSKRIFARAGVDIPIQTLNRWEGYAHQLLEPVIQLVKTRVLEADTINLDDTGLRVRDPTVKAGVVTGHIWVFVGRKYDPGGDLRKTREFVFYIYAPTWAAEHPETFLEGCPAVLQGDAYRGYERIASPNRGDKIEKLLAGCCMHARRPFAQALESKDASAVFFVERFQKIYRIEARAREENLTAPARLELRKKESLPLMQELYDRANELSSLPLLKPMKTGTTYLVNQWEKLLVPFTQDGRLDIDNGSAERRLRRVASGRRSWLFAGSQDGAERFADVLSLVSTAEAAGVEPGAYLPTIISNVDSWPNRRLEDLLPHRWRVLLEQTRLEQAPE